MNIQWNQFEKFNDCKYPKVIKEILKFCAIDRTTIDQLNNESIKSIEQFINQNKAKLLETSADSFKKSDYKAFVTNDEEFKFLFGHRLFLLNFSQKYKQFLDHQKNERKSRKEFTKELKSRDNKLNLESNFELGENSVEKVKKTLTEKINIRANKKYLVTETDVKKIHVLKGGHAYCFVQCPFCTKSWPCTYVSKSWNISNFNKHASSCQLLKNQKDIEEKAIDSSASPSVKFTKTAPGVKNKSFQTARTTVLTELNTILM